MRPNSVALQLTAVGMLTILVSTVDAFPVVTCTFPIVFTVLILSLCNDTGPVARVFQPKLFQVLGERSYSIYFMHMPLLLLFDNAAKRATDVLPNAIVLLTYVITLFVVSGWTYRLIEDALRRAFNRLADGSSPLETGVPSHK
jgi:peptidoglycan/LPS O-acetylase OafA/YrhL